MVGDDTPLVLDGYRLYTTSNKGFAPLLTWQQNGAPAVHGVLHGTQVARLDDAALGARLDATTIFCRVNPMQKARIVPDYAALGLLPEKPPGKAKPPGKPGTARPGAAKPGANRRKPN